LRAGNRTAIVIAFITATFSVGELSAHRRDELLQAARIAVDTNRLDLDLDLTPGIEVAEATITAADLDRDGSLSVPEQLAYCRRVLDAIRFELDGVPVQLQPQSCRFSDLAQIRNGEGTIQLRAATLVPTLSAGDHRLLFRNAFQPDSSVYLANALVPTSDAVAVTAQHRDGDQRSLAIDYRVEPGQTLALPLWPLGAAAGAALWLMVALRRGRKDVALPG
jgi:hypothetical protein